MNLGGWGMNPFIYIYVCMYRCMCVRREERGWANPAVGSRLSRAGHEGGGVGDRRRS
ncbi:hypothetical protein HanPI659440_Chr09g0346831 [Helianthus annuus]|nr:hypothetical protein HanPI659440_Chr09g0346831 [Helianthus annuus]